MDILHQIDSGTHVLTLNGRLDAGSAPELEEKAMGLVTADTSTLILDMSGVDYISSAGLRALLVLAKTVKSVQGTMVLHSVQSMVREVMEISGFDKILSVVADARAATEKIAAES